MTETLYCAYNGYRSKDHSGLLRIAQFDGKDWAARGVSNEVALSDAPNLTVYEGTLYCFMQTPKNGGWLAGKRYLDDRDVWQDLTIDKFGMSASPGAVSVPAATQTADLYVFCQGRGDSGVLGVAISSDGVSFRDGGVNPQTSGLFGGPTSVVWDSAIHTFYVKVSLFDPPQLMELTSGRTEPTLVAGATPGGPPAAVIFNKDLYVFYPGSNGKDLLYSILHNGMWTTDLLVPGVGMSASPTACVCNGNLFVMHRSDDKDGTLMYTFYEDGEWQPDEPVKCKGQDTSETTSASPSVASM